MLFRSGVLEHFPDQVVIRTMGEGFTWETQDKARDIAAAEKAWEASREMIADPSFDLVVLDELNIVLRYDHLPIDEVVAVLGARRPDLHVIVTGRNAKPELIEASRRLRIANGSGTQPNEVSNLVNQFKQMQKLMKRMGGMGSKRMKPARGKKGKKGKKGKGGGRVQGGRTNGRVSSRTTPKKGEDGSQKLMLPGLDQFEKDDELTELLKDLN